MKILVPVKRVLDYNLRPRIASDGSGVDLSNVKMSMNPFDEIAVEEAVRIKEAGKAQEIIAISIGSKQSQDVIRTALAMGADSGIHILHDDEIEPLAVAKILKYICDQKKPDLILCGKQAIDDDCNQTGQMLAGLMECPQATFASKVEIIDNNIKVTREVDGGLKTIQILTPAVVTTDLRLNEPRYASLPNIMKAKRKPIEEINSSDLGLDLLPRLKTISITEPPERGAGRKVESVSELLECLKNDGAL